MSLYLSASGPFGSLNTVPVVSKTILFSVEPSNSTAPRDAGMVRGVSRRVLSVGRVGEAGFEWSLQPAVAAASVDGPNVRTALGDDLGQLREHSRTIVRFDL